MRDELVLDRLADSGFAVVRGCGEAQLLAMAATLGRPVPEPRDGLLVKDIRPMPANQANRRTLSERHGIGPFPLHTEAAYWEVPPRFLLLYCRNPGQANRQTLLVDGEPLLRRPEVKSLEVEPWIVSAGVRSFLCTVLQRVEGSPCIRFDGECMRPTNRHGTARPLLDAFLSSATLVAHSWTVGDLLILDNHRVLHGRAAATVPDADRLLLKVLVTT